MTNWPTKKLGEICEIRTGKKDVDEGNPNGEYPFFSCSKEITYSDNYSFDTEAILIAGNGDVGNTKIYKGRFEAYQRTYVLDKFRDNIKYIYFYLIGNLKVILKKAKSGSTMPYIRKGDLENLEIPLPTLHIQQKIVRILDTIQETMGVQEKIIERTKELKKAIVNEIFNPKVKDQKPKLKFKIQEWIKLGNENYFEIKLGGTPKTNVDNYWNGDIYWITPNDLSKLDFQYIANTERKITKEGLKHGSNLLPAGSIILSTRAPIGYLAILNQDMAFNQGCKGIIIKKSDEVFNLYLFYYLTTQVNKLKDWGSGSTFKELSTSGLKEFSVPLTDVKKQREIAEILQTIDQKIEIEKRKKALYEELFKAMLNKLMNREIEVEKIDFRKQ